MRFIQQFWQTGSFLSEAAAFAESRSKRNGVQELVPTEQILQFSELLLYPSCSVLIACPTVCSAWVLYSASLSAVFAFHR